MGILKVSPFLFHFVFSCTLFLQIFFGMTKPISNEEVVKHKNSDSVTTISASHLIHFLKKFGYLDKSISSTAQIEPDHESLFTEETIEDAIREMQKFGAVPQTGKLDNETIALLSKPRCGLPDVVKQNNMSKRFKRYVIGSGGWNKRRISYRVDNWTPQLDELTVLTDIRKAFDVWADYARLRFVNIPRGSHDDVDISISFGRGYHGDTYPFDGKMGILAHAYYPQSHGSLGGDIHFDLDENWSSSSNSNEYNEYYSGTNVSFLAVSIHEIGHSLGLSHSPSTDSVMFPYYQGLDEETSENIRLGYDDIMAMYKLYIQREIKDFEDDNETDMPYSTEHTPESSTVTPTSSTTITNDLTTQRWETSSHETTEHVNGSGVPNLCLDGFDTIAFFRNELFVFKDKYVWRFRERGVSDPYNPYPVLTSRLFPMLTNVNIIDAAFENDEGQLVFFSGKYYWIYDETERFGPLPLSDFGLPATVEKLDAAFIWGKNRKLYFFSDNEFWRYSKSDKSVEEGYPKGIERWKGLPTTGIDSALVWSDGITYFFRNYEFWRFDDTEVHTDEGYPVKTSTFWFGC